MARVPEIIRQKPLSQVSARPADTSQGWTALADLVGMGAQFIKPAAQEQARQEGEAGVYRDADGTLKVTERSVLGGEMADIHNSAAYAKYLGQKQIDISQTFTELAQRYEFDPAGFQSAADAYLKLNEADENIPSRLKEGLLQKIREESQRRFNGLYNAQVTRNNSDAERNSRAARQMLIDDYTSLFVQGDFAGAEEKWAEIEAISQFRANAPYIRETTAETNLFLRAARGAAKAARLMRELGDMEGVTSIDPERRAEILGVLEDEDIDPAVRQKLYTATQGFLKGVDAAGIVEGLLDDSFFGRMRRASTGIDLSQFAQGGATRPDSFTGMTPDFNNALQQMFAAAPPEIQAALKINSGYRSPELQAQLWRDALAKYGSAAEARKWVAPPGNSQHNHGNAADLGFLNDAAREWVHENAGRFGLAFPLSNENWHIELDSARSGGMQAQRDANLAAITEAGLPVDDTTEFLAMSFGTDATIAMYEADPNDVVDGLLPASVIEANPILEGMTVRQLRNWAERRMTTKVSDMAVMAGQIAQIEDPEVRRMASQLLADRMNVRKDIEDAAAIAYEQRIAAPGDTVTAQEILEDQNLSDKAQGALVAKLEEATQVSDRVRETLIKLNDPNAYFDPMDTGTKNAVDDVYVAAIDGADPLGSVQSMMAAAEIASATGFMPRAAFNAVRGAIESGDPERLSTAMEFASAMLKEHPGAFANYSGRKVVTDALADYRFYAEMMPGPEAAQRLIDNAQDVPKNVTDQARDLAKGLDVSDIIDHFDTSWFSDPTIATDDKIFPETQDAMLAEYRRLFQDAFMKTGIEETAKARALDDIGRIYGPNEVSGSSRIMRYPPQYFFPAVNGSQAWMAEQLAAEVSSFVFGDSAKGPTHPGFLGAMSWVFPQNIKLVSDDTTAAQIRRGEAPSYHVYYMHDGVLKPMPQRYTFDASKLQAANREQFDAARQGAIKTSARENFYANVEKYGQEEALRMIREEEGTSNAVPQ